MRGEPRDYVVVHNPDKAYRSIDPMPMSRIEAEQYASKAHNVQAMHIDDAMRMFASDADASWTLLKIKSTLREGDVVDLNKFRAKKQAAQDALQRSKTPPPDDDETAEVTLQSLFDKLVESPGWKHYIEKQDHIFMISEWDNPITKEHVAIQVPKVIFHSTHMNTPASDATVEFFRTGREIDGEEFYHSL
jgi:hypothetical protein